MGCEGRRGAVEAKEIYDGGIMTKSERQYQERKMHTRRCVGIEVRWEFC